MPTFMDAITKVTKGTVYYGGLHAPKKIATCEKPNYMLRVFYEGLEEQKYLSWFGGVNCKERKFSPLGLTRAEFEAAKNIPVIPTIPTSL